MLGSWFTIFLVSSPFERVKLSAFQYLIRVTIIRDKYNYYLAHPDYTRCPQFYSECTKEGAVSFCKSSFVSSQIFFIIANDNVTEPLKSLRKELLFKTVLMWGRWGGCSSFIKHWAIATVEGKLGPGELGAGNLGGWAEGQMPREEEEEVILEFVLNLGYCE